MIDFNPYESPANSDSTINFVSDDLSRSVAHGSWESTARGAFLCRTVLCGIAGPLGCAGLFLGGLGEGWLFAALFGCAICLGIYGYGLSQLRACPVRSAAKEFATGYKTFLAACLLLFLWVGCFGILQYSKFSDGFQLVYVGLLLVGIIFGSIFGLFAMVSATIVVFNGMESLGKFVGDPVLKRQSARGAMAIVFWVVGPIISTTLLFLNETWSWNLYLWTVPPFVIGLLAWIWWLFYQALSRTLAHCREPKFSDGEQ